MSLDQFLAPTWSYIITHVCMPARLPYENDTSFQQDAHLITFVYSILTEYARLPALTSMLEKLVRVTRLGPLDKDVLGSVLQQLAVGGKLFFEWRSHIRCSGTPNTCSKHVPNYSSHQVCSPFRDFRNRPPKRKRHAHSGKAHSDISNPCL